MKYITWIILTTLLLLGACDGGAEGDASLSEEFTALESQVGDFESEIAAQTQKLDASQERVSELEAQLAEQEEQIAQVGALREERNGLQGRVEQLQGQLSTRTTALQEAQARVQTLTQQQGNILESEISDINTRIEALQQERSQLNARLSGEGAAQPAENASDNSSAQPEAPEGNE